jgi:hypothetical protein
MWLRVRLESRVLALVPIALGLVGAGCSSFPVFESYDEPYVISRVQRPSRTERLEQLERERERATSALEMTARDTVDVPPSPMEPAVAVADTDAAGALEDLDAARGSEPVVNADPGLRRASVVRARSRSRVVRGDRVVGIPIEDSTGTFAGVVRDVLLDTATGDVLGVVAARFGDEAGARTEVFEYEALQWALGDIGMSVAVADAADDRAEVLDGGIDYDTVFDASELRSIRGVVTELRPSEHERGSAILALRDAENRFHRVLVGAVEFASRMLVGLEVGESIQVDGILTRDNGGKLWIATAVTRGTQTVRLRDASGRVLWQELSGRFVSSRNVPTTIRASDGVTIPVHGWMLDIDAGSTAWLCIVVDGTLRLLPWDDVRRDPGGWSTDHDSASLGALRRLPVGPHAIEATATLGPSRQ